jgi:hypothetical protein
MTVHPVDLLDPVIPRKQLHVIFDVTGMPEHEIDALCGEAMVQGEASDDYTEGDPESGHRDVVSVTSAIVAWDQVETACAGCGKHLELLPSGLCESCQGDVDYERASS